MMDTENREIVSGLLLQLDINDLRYLNSWYSAVYSVNSKDLVYLQPIPVSNFIAIRSVYGSSNASTIF